MNALDRLLSGSSKEVVADVRGKEGLVVKAIVEPDRVHLSEGFCEKFSKGLRRSRDAVDGQLASNEDRGS